MTTTLSPTDDIFHRPVFNNSSLKHWRTGKFYDLRRILGKGSYGKVAEAVHRITGIKYAIKQMENIFDDRTDAKRAYREMHILRHLQHPNIIGLYDVISTTIPGSLTSDIERSEEISKTIFAQATETFVRKSGTRGRLGDLYLVFEYMDTDLSKILKSNQYMTLEHIQYILYQILLGLKYVHSSNVIHRDLKPANLLISCTDCTTKIADFGLARVVESSVIDSHHFGLPEAKVHFPTPVPVLARSITSHVVTRWYRAPEVILVQPYSAAVDIWSVGCILAELFQMEKSSCPDHTLRKPLFPGNKSGELSASTEDAEWDIFGGESGQLSVIFRVLGSPMDEDLCHLDSVTTTMIRNIAPKPCVSFRDLFPGATVEGLDLLHRMLHFNPNKRITVEEALAHPFLAEKRDFSREVSAPSPMSAAIESVGESTGHLYENVAHEVMHYRALDMLF